MSVKIRPYTSRSVASTDRDRGPDRSVAPLHGACGWAFGRYRRLIWSGRPLREEERGGPGGRSAACSNRVGRGPQRWHSAREQQRARAACRGQSVVPAGTTMDAVQRQRPTVAADEATCRRWGAPALQVRHSSDRGNGQRLGAGGAACRALGASIQTGLVTETLGRPWRRDAE